METLLVIGMAHGERALLYIVIQVSWLMGTLPSSTGSFQSHPGDQRPASERREGREGPIHPEWYMCIHFSSHFIGQN